MQKMKPVCLFFLLFFISLVRVESIKAQSQSEIINISSPNVASMEIFGKIPVSLYTGIPQIEVPLYSLETNGITVPVSLNYHASGVRPDQHPSWVGVGWSLNAGGVIARTIKKYPDEFGKSDIPDEYFGYYYNTSAESNMMHLQNWNNKEFMASTMLNPEYISKEFEPDEFSFILPGLQGSFFLNHNGEWDVRCDRSVKVITEGFVDLYEEFQLISPPRDMHNSSFFGFTLIADDGIQYTFGMDKNAIECSTDYFSQYNAPWFADSWYLTKITHPNGNVIKFIYNRDSDYINSLYISINQVLRDEVKVKRNGFFDFLKAGGCSNINSNNNLNDFIKGRLISPVYLSKIESDNGTLYFQRSISKELKYDEYIYKYKLQQELGRTPTTEEFKGLYPYVYNANYTPETPIGFSKLNWKQLDKMSIINSLGDTIREIGFNYSKDESCRLFLGSIIDSRKTRWGYQFVYNQMDRLPKYLSNKVDHWGFYNNINPGVLPQDFNAYYNSRDSVNLEFLSLGVLASIVYPTGGKTKFIYEPHQYKRQLKDERWLGYDELPNNKTTGGLRIKEIRNLSSDDSILEEKKYYYTTDIKTSNSSGILGGQVEYYLNDYQTQSYEDPNRRYFRNIFSSTSILPGAMSTQGSHIGYSTVFEKNADGSYTKHTFSNFDNGYLDQKYENTLNVTHSIYQPYNDFSYTRGKLLSKEEFTPDGRIVHSQKTTYPSLSSLKNYVIALYNNRDYTCDHSAAGQYFDATAYKVYTGAFLPISNSEILFNVSSGKPIQESINKYSYNSKNLLKTDSTIIHKGSVEEIRTTHINYSWDLNNKAPSCSEMVNRYMINYPVEIIKTVNNNITEGYLTMYNNCFPSHKFKLPNAMQFSNFVFFDGKSLNNYISPEYSITQYSNSGIKNILEIKGANEISTVFLWGYKGQHPIARIVNATYSQVKAVLNTDPEMIASATLPDMNQINNLRNLLPEAQVYTYTYAPFIGLTTSIDPKGFTTYYNYDSLSRLIEIRDYKYQKKNRFEYRYKLYGPEYPTFPGPDNDNPPINVSVSRVKVSGSSYGIDVVNDKYLYTINAIGGSNLFLYNWYLKNSNGNIIASSYNSVENKLEIVFPETGLMTLALVVTDKKSGIAKTQTQQINVRDLLLEFIDIKKESSQLSNEWGKVSAKINCYKESLVTFQLVMDMGTSIYGNATFTIGTYVLNMNQQANKTIELTLPAGMTDISVYITKGNQGVSLPPARIIIVKANGSSSETIGNNRVLTF